MAEKQKGGPRGTVRGVQRGGQVFYCTLLMLSSFFLLVPHPKDLTVSSVHMCMRRSERFGHPDAGGMVMQQTQLLDEAQEKQRRCVECRHALYVSGVICWCNDENVGCLGHAHAMCDCLMNRKVSSRVDCCGVKLCCSRAGPGLVLCVHFASVL